MQLILHFPSKIDHYVRAKENTRGIKQAQPINILHVDDRWVAFEHLSTPKRWLQEQSAKSNALPKFIYAAVCNVRQVVGKVFAKRIRNSNIR